MHVSFLKDRHSERFEVRVFHATPGQEFVTLDIWRSDGVYDGVIFDIAKARAIAQAVNDYDQSVAHEAEER